MSTKFAKIQFLLKSRDEIIDCVSKVNFALYAGYDDHEELLKMVNHYIDTNCIHELDRNTLDLVNRIDDAIKQYNKLLSDLKESLDSIDTNLKICGYHYDL